MKIEIFDNCNDEACHEAEAASYDECCAMLYKQLADEYSDAGEAMPAHISEASILEFFARSEFDIKLMQ